LAYCVSKVVAKRAVNVFGRSFRSLVGLLHPGKSGVGKTVPK
jgi:hypothetical protein